MGAALELALDDQRQGRALHAADGEEVGAEAAAGERDGAGQRRAPDQVDVLARGAGVGEVVGELVEVGEGALDLVLGQRRVAGALDRRPRASSSAAGDAPGSTSSDLLQRLEPDQLALAVEVGRDHDRVGLLGELAHRLDHVLVGRLGHQLGVDQVVEVGLLPVRVALGEGDAHHVALEPDGHLLALGVAPGVERHLVGGVGLRLAAAEDLGDLLRRVVLLRDDQPHRRRESSRGSERLRARDRRTSSGAGAAPAAPHRLAAGRAGGRGSLPSARRCPLRPTQARNASASTSGGSATRAASAGCSRRRSTSPACGSRGRDCLVVGGGEVGLEKVEGLLACDGRRDPGRARRGRRAARARRRGLDRLGAARVRRAADLEGKFLAIAATDDTDVNIAVYDDAERRAMLVNVVDVPVAVQLHPPGDRPHRPAGDRDLDRRRLAGAGEADQARDRRRRSASPTRGSR